jgi:transposase
VERADARGDVTVVMWACRLWRDQFGSDLGVPAPEGDQRESARCPVKVLDPVKIDKASQEAKPAHPLVICECQGWAPHDKAARQTLACPLDLAGVMRQIVSVHDRHDLTEEEWAQLEPLLPDQTPRRGVRWADHRSVINGVLWRIRTGCPWRYPAGDYGHWKTFYHRHRRWSADGTWAKVLDELRRGGDQSASADHGVEWSVGMDSMVVGAHQHAAGARHGPPPHLAAEVSSNTEADTGGWVE